MFRVTGLLILVIFITRIFFSLRSNKNFITDITSKIRKMFNQFLSYRKQSTGFFQFIRILIYLIFLFCVSVLAVSGFYQPLVFGKPISGFLLIIHVTIAPVFALGSAALSIVWAHTHEFNQKDYISLKQIFKKESSSAIKKGEKSIAFLKIGFWLALVLSLLLIISIVFSMFNYFGTEGQDLLQQIHRYSAMLLVIVVGIHSSMLLNKKK